MAIRIIEGVPGSGKSYYAVRHVANTYFEKQDDGRYELIKPVTIITNIDAFKPDHLSLQNCIKDAGGIKSFFEESFQKALTECLETPVVYIIDEAQKIFRRGTRDMGDVWSYFEYHRHFGHDIYLITQNSRKLPTDLTTLVEYKIIAAPRSRSVIGEFKYKWVSSGDILKREAFRPDAGIFALYKSMDQAETEKVKNPIIPRVIAVLCLVLCVFGGGIYYFYSVWMAPAKKNAKVAASPSPAAQASSQPVQVKAGPAAPAPDPVVTVVVSMLTEIDSALGFEKSTQYVIFQDVVYPRNLYPYPLRRVAGQWWSDVPSSKIKVAAEDAATSGPGQPDRRNDSASGSAHGPADRGQFRPSNQITQL